MNPQPLAPEDAARLRMGVPENPMVITAALVLDRPLARDALEALLQARLLCHERFRMRVVEPRFGWGTPRWAEVASVDVREHCVGHPVRGDGPALERIVEEAMNEPLDPDRPLWRLHVVDRVGQGAALVFRVHHVIADGAALVAVLGGLADEGAAKATSGRPQPPAPAPRRLLALLGGAAAATRLALRPSDPPTSLHGPLGASKRVAYSSPLPLPRLAQKARAAGVTVTEWLLAAVAGALRARLAADRAVRDLTVHALVPVGLPAAAGGDAGNHYASVFVDLPLAEMSEWERSRRVAESLRAARARSALRAGLHLVGAAGASGRSVERLAVSFFSRKASVVVSSIRGPTGPLHIGGALLRDILVWAPAPGTIALSVTLMSYTDRVRVGVAADERVIGDAAPLVAALERALGGPPHRA